MPGSEIVEEKPKKKKWPWVLGILGVLLLGIGGCTFIFVRAALGPINEANDFLADVRDGNTTAAVDSIAPVCRPGDPAGIAAELGRLNITDFNMNDTTINSSDGESTGTASGSVVSNGVQTPAFFQLRRVDGDWRICEFQIGPVSSP